MGRKVYVVGVGMTKFTKPGEDKLLDYPAMALEAVNKALDDAGLSYNVIEQAVCGYVYGDSTCGQKALYPIGMTGIPIINVNNNCSTGSSALYLIKSMVEGGLIECGLAVGFEKMEKGSLTSKFKDRVNPMNEHIGHFFEMYGLAAAPVTAQLFGAAGLEHMKNYGTKEEHFAKIAVKNHKHSVNNPYSQFQEEYTMEQVLNAPKVYEYLTRPQCCPTSNGSAAAIIASESFVKHHSLNNSAVEILAMTMASDTPSTFSKSAIKLVGFDMTASAAKQAFTQASLTPKDVQVVELHDCFSSNELISYEALGLCDIGEAAKFIDSGNNDYGGKVVVNPSGGLLSKGHPLGATGIAQCAELCWQCRGLAGNRQVNDVKVALQHNIGLGGAVVIGLYSRRKAKTNARAHL